MKDAKIGGNYDVVGKNGEYLYSINVWWVFGDDVMGMVVGASGSGKKYVYINDLRPLGSVERGEFKFARTKLGAN